MGSSEFTNFPEGSALDFTQGVELVGRWFLMQLDAEKFSEIVLKSLEFRTTTLTLVLGASGFAAARLWPENKRLPDASLFFRLAPSAIASAFAFWKLSRAYTELGLAVSGHAMITFAAAWANGVIWLDLSIAIAFVLLCVGVGIRH